MVTLVNAAERMELKNIMVKIVKCLVVMHAMEVRVRIRGPNTTSYPYDLVLIRPRIFEKGRMSYQVVLV